MKKIKMFMLFMTLVCVCSLCGFAQDVPNEKKIGRYGYRVLEDGKGVEIVKCYMDGTILTIPETIEGLPVVSVGKNAFTSVEAEKVILPKYLKRVEEYAFKSAYVGEVVLNEGVEFIGQDAFSFGKLKKINLPKSILDIESEAFARNEITEVVLPESLTILKDGIFEFNALTHVVIPKNVELIDSHAFYGNAIKDVTFLGPVKEIKGSAFAYNEISHVDLPEELEAIHAYAFKYNKITSLRLPSGLKKLHLDAFDYKRLTQVSTNSKVQFWGCGYLCDFDQAFVDFDGKAGTYKYDHLNRKWLYSKEPSVFDDSRRIAGKTTIDFTMGSTKMWVNGVAQELDNLTSTTPLIESGKMFVPAMPTIKALYGYGLQRGNHEMGTFVTDKVEIRVWIDERKVCLNGVMLPFTGNVQIKGNVIYFSEDFIETFLGAQKKWDPSTKTLRFIKG